MDLTCALTRRLIIFRCELSVSVLGILIVIYQNSYDIVLDDIFLDLADLLPEVTVLLKLEGFNPAGSIKLKTAVSLIEDLEKHAQPSRGCHIIESSSGNIGIALSVVCAAKGYPLTIVTDPNASTLSLRMMETLGTEVVIVAERDANGGFLGSRIAYIAAALARDSTLLWPNQYANWANAQAHYERTARSIHQTVPHADSLVIGVGTTGTLMGCVSYYAEHSPATRLIAVDAVGSVLFGGAQGPRHIPGIGASRVPEIFVDDNRFERVAVPEQEAIAMCQRLASERGILVGGSTGSALAAVRRLRETFRPGSTVVTVSPDLGTHYLDSVYEESWVGQVYGDPAESGG
jgi:N-(2-amino-2-carboxyethyl)-L-glutamate synthase